MCVGNHRDNFTKKEQEAYPKNSIPKKQNELANFREIIMDIGSIAALYQHEIRSNGETDSGVSG